jgi:putative two-component system response regulator
MAENGLDLQIDNSNNRKKIIYVDDVTYSLKSLKNRLTEFYDIFPAESASKMFELLTFFKPDLILLDVNMPEINGYEAIRSLKADDRYAEIPVIFLTSSSDRDSVVKGLSLGAVDYVIKPFVVSKLVESIENNLNPRKNKMNSHEDDADKPSVLIVDDVDSMLRAMQYALQDRYNVHIISKPENVMDFLRYRIPDLILLDYMMPVLNGFDLIHMIREVPEYNKIPIIIITSEGTPDHVNKAMSLGASDFIVKPFKPFDLNIKISKHIMIAKELRQLNLNNKMLFNED